MMTFLITWAVVTVLGGLLLMFMMGDTPTTERASRGDILAVWGIAAACGLVSALVLQGAVSLIASVML